MSDYLQVLLLALMPSFGNFGGAVVAELVPISSRTLSRALHAASGIVVAVVAVELMPETLGGAAPPWAIVFGLCLGGAAYIGLDWIVSRIQRGKERLGSAWLIYMAVAIDLFSDGLMIGVGSAVSFSLAFILALGQLMGDAPEGFAAIANFKNKGLPRRHRLLLSVSLFIPCLAGASVGYWMLQGQGEVLTHTALALIAGILLVAAAEELLPQAHEVIEDTHYSAAFFIGGFALFTLVASYFEA